MSDRETFIEELPCKLTEKERLERADRAAELQEQHRALKQELKEQADAGKRKLKGLELKHRELSEAVRTRQERRPVECIQRDNVTTERREKVRSDTGKVFWSRPLTRAELAEAKQVPMRFADGGGRTRVRKPALPEPPTAEQLVDAIEEHLAEEEPEHDEDGVVLDSEPPPDDEQEPGAGNLPGRMHIEEEPPAQSDPGDEELFE